MLPIAVARSVPLSVCLPVSVSPNYVSHLHEIVCTCYCGLMLDDMLRTFNFVDGVSFGR